ncbi:MAG: hypothetical protein ABI680_01770, partial [Chthoniobacteraceae bacterium]
MSVESYIPILLINGQPVSIASFSLDAPDGKIGIALSFNLVDVADNPERGDTVDFSIVTSSGTFDLITGGFVVGRSRRIGSSDSSPKPADSFDATAADALGERRFAITPRIPLIYFDAEFITLGDGELDSHVSDETGARIYATSFPVVDLDFYKILNYAYVTGAGFSSVVTNIPNFAVRRQDFPLSSSFHKSVSSLYAPYKPMIYEEDGVLFIINPRGTLPVGFDEIGAQIRTSDLIKMERAKPDKTAVNAILLTTHPTTIEEIPIGVTE